MIVDMTFAGRSASEFGILIKTHRSLRAPMGQRLLKIPGRHGSFDFGKNTFEMQAHQVDCFVRAVDLPALRLKMREIAAWIASTGRLSFSDEPDKYYIAKVYDQSTFEQLAEMGQWSITFVVGPFAFGREVQILQSGVTPLAIPIRYGATAQTPCRIVIRNAGSTAISGVRITQFVETKGGV